jgi:hypothetical protein
MKRTAFALLAATVLVCGGLFAPSPARADASRPLVNVLVQIQALSNDAFGRMVGWARNGSPMPAITTTQPEATEANVLNLAYYDRAAVLSWLQGNGRGALYSQGATDGQIGGRRPGADYPIPTPTPNLWRNLPLASATLDGNVQGGISIIGGFAAARRDGTSAIACVSFKNTSAKVASRVLFEFPLLDRTGQILAKLTLDRSGEFSPDIAIMSYTSFNDWQGNSVGPRGRLDSCITRKLPTAAMPFLQARAAGYRVLRVEYADGTSWVPNS